MSRDAAWAASRSRASSTRRARRGLDHVDVIYEAGEGGHEAFFSRVGFSPVSETQYGEVVAEIRL